MCIFVFLIDTIYLGLVFFFIYCDTLCLLIDVFRALTLKVIIDIVELISTIFVTIFYLLLLSLFLF